MPCFRFKQTHQDAEPLLKEGSIGPILQRLWGLVITEDAQHNLRIHALVNCSRRTSLQAETQSWCQSMRSPLPLNGTRCDRPTEGNESSYQARVQSAKLTLTVTLLKVFKAWCSRLHATDKLVGDQTGQCELRGRHERLGEQLTAMSPGGAVHPTLEACSSRKSTICERFCEAASQVTLVCVCSVLSDSSPGKEEWISASTLHKAAALSSFAPSHSKTLSARAQSNLRCHAVSPSAQIVFSHELLCHAAACYALGLNRSSAAQI